MATRKKTCKRCGQAKLPGEFNGSSKETDGLAVYCRACVNERRRELHKKTQAMAKDEPKGSRGSWVKAARMGDVVRLQVLIKGDPNLSHPDCLARMLGSVVGNYQTVRKTDQHIEALKLLIQQGAKPHWQHVCEAASGGHLALAEFLINAGVEPNIFVACVMGDDTNVKEFIRKRPALVQEKAPAYQWVAGWTDCGQRGGMTPLHACALSRLGEKDTHCAKRLAAIAGLLIEKGAAVDAADDSGTTALTYAVATGGNVNIVRLLVAHGACLEEKHLDSAVEALIHGGDEQIEIADFIWDSGVASKQKYKHVHLGNCMSQGGTRMGEWLIRHGADVNRRDDRGVTVLHRVAERTQWPQAAKLLLQYGAELNARDDSRKTPLARALAADKHKVANFLKSQGAVC